MKSTANSIGEPFRYLNWSLLQIDTGLPNRRFKEEQMRKKLILARNKNEAAYYATLKGLSPDEWAFVINKDCFSKVSGKDFDFIITGSADKRDDFSQLCKIATELSFLK